MLKAVRSVIYMSLFLMLLLSGLLCSASDFPRKYYYINESMTWPAAQSYCREKYTDLATLDSMDDVNRILQTGASQYDGSVWIGLKRGIQGQWIWSLNEAVTQYSVWGVPEPSGDGLCVNILAGYWNDCPCGTLFYFVCNNGVEYVVIHSAKTWQNARSYCRQYYTDLAMAHTFEEHLQIISVVGSLKAWIGLYLDAWQWSDQWSLVFRNWKAGYTSLNTEFGNCVAMSTASGKWVQYHCGNLHHFICYDVHRKHVLRLNLSCNGNCDLKDPSLQIATVNEIGKKLKSVGLGNYISINLRKD